MPRPRCVFLPLCFSLLLSVGCRQSPQPAAQQAAPVAPVAATPQHMQDHFAKVRQVEDAIVLGDLDAAKASARWIVEHQDANRSSATERPLEEMRAAATALVAAADIDHGAAAAARMIGACGSCHTAAKVEPTLPAVTEAAATDPKVQQMLEHRYAVERMHRGLVVLVNDQWWSGAKALKAAPLRPKAFKGLSEEIAAAEASFQTLADRALKAPDRAARVAVYGELLGSCAKCHALHRRARS